MKNENDVFIFSDRKGTHQTYCDEITHFEGNGRCCIMHTMKDEPRHISQNLSRVLKQLAGKPYFIKIYKSNIINTNNIKSYLTEDGGTALMKNDTKVPIARDKRDIIKRIVNQA